jgi:hypothetical protein
MPSQRNADAFATGDAGLMAQKPHPGWIYAFVGQQRIEANRHLFSPAR